MITTVDIKINLWEAAETLAIKEKTDLKTIVNDSLEMYLKEKAKRERVKEK
jgi:hypothetical protein